MSADWLCVLLAGPWPQAEPLESNSLLLLAARLIEALTVQLLTEAERQRELVGNPMALKGDLDNSMANLAARQEDAARHNRYRRLLLA